MTKSKFLGVINDLDDDLINGYLKKCCKEDETVQPFYSSPAEMPLWKRIVPAAAAICAVLAIVIGGARIINLKLNENSPANTNDPAVNNVNSEVEQANKAAWEAQGLMNIFISSCTMGGYGYDGESKELSYIVLTVEDGVWSCISDMHGFISTDKISWTGRVDGITGITDDRNASSAEEKLCILFSQIEVENGTSFKNLKNATFQFLINKDYCTGAIYVDTPFSEIIGDFGMFDPSDYGGKFPESCNWSGGEAGILKEKTTGKTIIVGTSPVVAMDENAPVLYDEDAATYASRNAKELYATINTFLDSMEENGIILNKLEDPRTITVEVSYGRYSTRIDEDLVLTDKNGKFNFRLIHTIEDEYDYSHAWIKAYIVNGKCEGIVFMAGSGGESYSYPAYEDFQKGSYSWDSEEEIGSKNGITMGVYPELAYEKTEEVTWEGTTQEPTTPSSAIMAKVVTLFGENIFLPCAAKDLGGKLSISDSADWVIIEDVITSNLYYGDKKIGTVNLAEATENPDEAKITSLYLGFGLSGENIPDEETRIALYNSYGWYSGEIELDYFGLSFKSTQDEIIKALGTPTETTDEYFDDFLVYQYSDGQIWIKFDKGNITEFDIRLS